LYCVFELFDGHHGEPRLRAFPDLRTEAPRGELSWPNVKAGPPARWAIGFGKARCDRRVTDLPSGARRCHRWIKETADRSRVGGR
jgi:hypothetical protein